MSHDEFETFINDIIDGFYAEYKEKAVCHSLDLKQKQLFYSYKSSEQARAAFEFCPQCPLAKECLKVALLNQERFGVWGGTLESTRRGMFSTLRSEMGIHSFQRWKEENWVKMQELIDQLYASPTIPFTTHGVKRQREGRANPMYFEGSVSNDQLEVAS